VSASVTDCKDQQHDADHNDGRCIPETGFHFTPNPCCDRAVQSAPETRRSTLGRDEPSQLAGLRRAVNCFQRVTDLCPLSVMCVQVITTPRCSDFTISQIGGMTVSISLKREVWRQMTRLVQAIPLGVIPTIPATSCATRFRLRPMPECAAFEHEVLDCQFPGDRRRE
jgi:hypothetical protein